MVRRIASQVHKQASRLLQGNYLKDRPAWFQAVLDHPPLPLPPRAPPTRTGDDRPARTSSSRPQDPKVLPIIYLEDEIRRQFFRDHPFEAFRPTTLTEGGAIRDEHPIRGKEWTRLRQRGRNPSPEDCILFTLTLHRHHSLSLNQAYIAAVAQFRALRSEHYVATLVAAKEAEQHGARFGVTQTDILFQKETKALETWRKKEEQDLSAMASRKRWRAIVERDGPVTEFTKGREYVRLWKEGIRPDYAPVLTSPEITEAERTVEEKSDFIGVMAR
ncbi:hypothetical protein GLOTRDRAFT_102247 [Gloeophyllum trabeum ATCC 11539]|uniref:Small ribosomal subunit protein mS23 n=1 Tax=Gloeophyllum trabeum (strain ATCC 11539 / FP-39264 / Madison 617) TaxID=670483 RepID=S7QM71_GLOTA|nr:uncharacterized protein GLOTRDRAFT_102247 [Gloeophyllum trabeum ATCC 11539]EPQ60487.1 hypothetical protein GLOTRDRAFT_102247 [Gloeophyllum trabeum ATCC 11539]